VPKLAIRVAEVHAIERVRLGCGIEQVVEASHRRSTVGTIDEPPSTGLLARVLDTTVSK
jgi:hypothetical protein